MPFIDHEHRHQWERLGVTRGETGLTAEVVYQCVECDAWTSLTLRNSAYVYSVDEHGRITCINLFRETFEQRLETDPSFRRAIADLHGQTLGCWCRAVDDDGPPCHGDVISEWADRLVDE